MLRGSKICTGNIENILNRLTKWRENMESNTLRLRIEELEKENLELYE